MTFQNRKQSPLKMFYILFSEVKNLKIPISISMCAFEENAPNVAVATAC